MAWASAEISTQGSGQWVSGFHRILPSSVYRYWSIWVWVDEFQRAIRLEPGLPLVHKKLGKAMAASGRNYEIVERKYSEGTVSITDLVDAQEDKFEAQAAAVVSVYDFLKDLADFDRAISNFYFLAGENERKTWLEEVQEHFKARELGG